jgi:protein-arginine deiminase
MGTLSHLARLDVDANRDGEIDADEPGRWDWAWSPTGAGAIVVPDVDREAAGEPNAELTELRLVVDEQPPAGVELALSIEPLVASLVTVHRRGEGGELQPIAGMGAGPDGGTTTFGGPLDPKGESLWVQAHGFPDAAFSGLVEILLFTVAGRTLQSVEDSVLLRVAPWIMTPNTLEPERVYVVSLSGAGNEEFLRGLRAACDEAGVELESIEGELVGGDRWIQDEIEFGYSQAPGRTHAVVCDGPRNAKLDYLAEARLLGPDLGVVEVRSHLDTRSSLDSFGNLEVSPPVEVGGIRYPLGRIVLGTRRRGPSNSQVDRKATLALREFLYAQVVQAPFEAHTDWLEVGHVDEIVSFVPASSALGFQILIASPRRARKLFEKCKKDGHGEAILWQGQQRIDREAGRLTPAEEKVDDLLANADLWKFNDECAAHLDGVRADLERELGAGDDAFLEIPVAFKPVGPVRRALAYFPDMVNHLVLGDISVVPKPYGPRIDGKDPLEQAFVEAVPERKVRFIDDWLAYHEMSGEVHCGTNVRRRPAAEVRWWEHRLPGTRDSSVRPRG